jgi:hypothetical protein
MFNDVSSRCPTFERGKDRWIDFAALIRTVFRVHETPDDIAKQVLWMAIKGRSSRIVVASMDPVKPAYQNRTLDEYMEEMSRKFTPASESVQMKAEYQNRRQGKQEDIQNYINEKFELFSAAYPGDRQDLTDFFAETTKGIYNRYVRQRMYEFDGNNVEAYGARAVFMVQVQRQQIMNGDSEETSLDGLVPVTRTGNVSKGGPEAMEIDYLRPDKEEDDNDECECMAMHEQGFRGPCYYCQRKGHMVRNCPRKSAGLPKIRMAAQPQIQRGYGNRDGGKKFMGGRPTGAAQKPMKRGGKRVNNIESDQGDQPDEEEDEIEEDDTNEEEEVGFLGETL